MSILSAFAGIEVEDQHRESIAGKSERDFGVVAIMPRPRSPSGIKRDVVEDVRNVESCCEAED